MVRICVPLALTITLISQGCSHSAAAAEQQEAVQVFKTFQGALFRSETATIRRLLTRQSRRFAHTLARQQLTGRQPLQVLGTSQVRNQLRVHVRDPNDGDRESFFVLVKEDGSIRVDLVATTAYNKVERRRPGPREVVRQKRLTPREIEKIRALTKEVIR
jgi:hypothetical protein